jgi:NAD(P)-dependent dehydrogenase (short-subunit alcohol dehydrogenase family)
MIAVVTGGCSGLGESFTKYLISLGYKVYAIYNSSVDEAIQLESNYDNLRCIKCDIRNEEMVENTFFNIDNIDILVNNAGIAHDNLYQDKTKKEFMSVIETNLVGNFLVTKYAIPKLSSNGKIINISSNNAIDNNSIYSMDYDASKAGINMLTKDFALTLDENKKIVAICPGWINTESIRSMDQNFLNNEMMKSNQDKLIEPDDLAKYVIDNINNYESGSIIEIKNL